MKNSPSITVLVLAETGSDYESKGENGLSHFLEHMIFKATEKRKTFLEIGRELESMGAASNAMTSNELTYYYAKSAKKHFKKLLDVISDMYLNATIPEDTLDKERGVILQEISMYEDLPQRKVWDVLMKLLYGDAPAGRPTLGPKENIKKFTREDFLNYKNAHYVASKTVVVVAGDVDNKEAISEIRKTFAGIPEGKRVKKPAVKEKQKAPNIEIFKKDTDQTHLMLAFRAFSAKDKRANSLHLLAYIMGKGFSSRLFQKMREEMGACYYVGSDFDDYTDHGAFVISAGIEAKRAEEVVRALLEECKKFTTELVENDELKKAKEFLLSKLAMRLEATDEVADYYVAQEILTGNPKNFKEINREIRAVTSKDIQKVAKDVFKNENLNLAIVGDIKDSAKIKKALKL